MQKELCQPLVHPQEPTWGRGKQCSHWELGPQPGLHIGVARSQLLEPLLQPPRLCLVALTRDAGVSTVILITTAEACPHNYASLISPQTRLIRGKTAVGRMGRELTVFPQQVS